MAAWARLVSSAARTGMQFQPLRTAAPRQAVRYLNIHEYQSQDLLRKYDIAVPSGRVANSPADAEAAAKDLGVDDVVIKAQVLAGGRGKGHFSNGFQGGVHLCKTSEVKGFAEKMIGGTLITKQTGAEGKPCNSVLVAKRFSVKSEMYVAILLDRATYSPVIVGSPAGGMNIEEVAEKTPEKIHKISLDVSTLDDPESVPLEILVDLAKKLGVTSGLEEDAARQIRNLYKMFCEIDATMVEINPLIETKEGELLFADAKVNIDDNASFRQEGVFALKDPTQEDKREVAAGEYDLNFIGLDGNIGCLVNGAGLAMATMDIIKLHGGEPANFLDIGGGADEEQVAAALRILTSDPNVQAILLNIFGGIMRCDVIATGMINAVSKMNLSIPIIIRLEGTNVDLAREMIEESGMALIVANDIADAAAKAVKAAKENKKG